MRISVARRRRGISAGTGALVLGAGLAALGLEPCLKPNGSSVLPGVAEASPASLHRELIRFRASAESRGLSFCALFAPVGCTAAADSSRVLSIGADQALIPASLAKIATASCALERLGPAHVWETRVYAGGPIENGILRGDLFVRAGGDPYLVSERIWLLADQLRNAGIREVRGRLVIDGSGFVPDALDPGRSQARDASTRPYAARLSPLTINFNAAAVRVAPGLKAGDPASVVQDPISCDYLRIENRLVTGPPAGAAAHRADRDLGGASGAGESGWTIRLEPAKGIPTPAEAPARGRRPEAPAETLVAEGMISAGAEPELVYRSVADPARFSASLLAAFLREAGIAIDGPTVAGTVTDQARLLLDFPSPPLSDIVRSADRYSNNLMADLIAMELSRADSSKPASLTEGARLLTAWLETVAAGDSVRLLDGSGLNPADRVTGRVILRILSREWQDLRIQADLASSFPSPGEEGTLRRRFPHGPVLRAKTGTMGDPRVSGIAGYLEDHEQSPIAFVLLMNAAPGTAWDIPKLQELQERWIEEYALTEVR